MERDIFWYTGFVIWAAIFIVVVTIVAVLAWRSVKEFIDKAFMLSSWWGYFFTKYYDKCDKTIIYRWKRTLIRRRRRWYNIRCLDELLLNKLIKKIEQNE